MATPPTSGTGRQRSISGRVPSSISAADGAATAEIAFGSDMLSGCDQPDGTEKAAQDSGDIVPQRGFGDRIEDVG